MVKNNDIPDISRTLLGGVVFQFFPFSCKLQLFKVAIATTIGGLLRYGTMGSNSFWNCIFIFIPLRCMAPILSTLEKSRILKGRIKSEDTGEFYRLKKIFQISLLSYYIQYMTMIEYLCNLLYCKLENTIIIRFN